MRNEKYLFFQFISVERLIIAMLFVSAIWIGPTLIAKLANANLYKTLFFLIALGAMVWLISSAAKLLQRVVFLLVFLIPVARFNVPFIRHHLPWENFRLYILVVASMAFISLILPSIRNLYSRKAKIVIGCTILLLIESIFCYWLGEQHSYFVKAPFFIEIFIWMFLFAVIVFIFTTKCSSNPNFQRTIIRALFVIYIIDILLTILQQKYGVLATPFAAIGKESLNPNTIYRGIFVRSSGYFFNSLRNGAFIGLFNIFFLCVYLFKVNVLGRLPRRLFLIIILVGFIASTMPFGRTAVYGQAIVVLLLWLICRRDIKINKRTLFIGSLIILSAIAAYKFFGLQKEGYFSALDRLALGASVKQLELSYVNLGRFYMVASNLPLVKENMVLGIGPTSGHSEVGYFTVLLRYGMVGLFLFCAPSFFLVYKNIIKRDVPPSSVAFAASWAILFALSQLTLTVTFSDSVILIMLYYLLMAFAAKHQDVKVNSGTLQVVR